MSKQLQSLSSFQFAHFIERGFLVFLSFFSLTRSFLLTDSAALVCIFGRPVTALTEPSQQDSSYYCRLTCIYIKTHMQPRAHRLESLMVRIPALIRSVFICLLFFRLLRISKLPANDGSRQKRRERERGRLWKDTCKFIKFVG